MSEMNDTQRGKLAGVAALTTKGDLLTYSDTPARLPAGTDGHVLTADSSQALGVKWAEAEGGSGNGAIFDHQFVGTGTVECWYPAGVVTAVLHSAAAYSADTIYALPIVTLRGGTIDRLAIDVTVGSGSANNSRIAVFAASSATNPYPGALVGQATVSANAAAISAATVNLTLTPGTLYWVAFKTAGTPTLRNIGNGAVAGIFGLPSTLGTVDANARIQLNVAEDGDTDFGSSFPAGATAVKATAPALFYRWSA